MINPSKVYLGDSVCVEFENDMLKLTTNNGYPDDPRNVIFLGQEEWQALQLYVKRLKEGG